MKKRTLRQDDYFGHMLDAVRQIQQYTSGKTYETFAEDRFLQDAVIRNIEVLGEASRKLLDSVQDAQ